MKENPKKDVIIVVVTFLFVCGYFYYLNKSGRVAQEPGTESKSNVWIDSLVKEKWQNLKKQFDCFYR